MDKNKNTAQYCYEIKDYERLAEHMEKITRHCIKKYYFGKLEDSPRRMFSYEDLVQEILTRVWRVLPTYDPKQAKISTWMFTIIRNEITRFANADFVNKFRLIATPEVESEEGEAMDFIEKTTFVSSYNKDLNNLETIQEILNVINEEEKKILELMLKMIYHNGAYSNCGIGEKLGLSRTTVANRFDSIRRKARRAGIEWVYEGDYSKEAINYTPDYHLLSARKEMIEND